MREKIVQIIRENIGHGYESEPHYIDDAAHQILTLLREEIKKVENPYDEVMEGLIAMHAYEDCRKDILKALEEK